MQFDMKLFDAAFAELGNGRAAGKAGLARFGQGKGADGGESMEGTGFAEIMAALTRMPSEALPVSLEQLAQMVRQADEGTGAPLMALLHAHGRGPDHPLWTALMEGAPAGQRVSGWPPAADGAVGLPIPKAGGVVASAVTDTDGVGDVDGQPVEGKGLAGRHDFRAAEGGQDRGAVPGATVRGGDAREVVPEFKTAHGGKADGPGTDGAQRVAAEKDQADKALQAKVAMEKAVAEAGKAGELRVADKAAQGRAAGTLGERDEKLTAAVRQAAQQALGAADGETGRPGSDEERAGRGRDTATRGGILFQKGEGKSAVPEPFGPMTGQDGAQSRSVVAGTGPSNEVPGGTESRPTSPELVHSAKTENGPEPQPLPRNVQSDVMRQIVQRMTLHTEGRQAMMQIQLKPEMLGQLRMQIITENQQVTIRIAAQNSQVKQLIEQNMHVLRNELQQQGLHIQKVDVVVPHDPQQDPWQNPRDTAFQNPRQRQGHQGRSRQATGRNDSVSAAAAGNLGEGLQRSGRHLGARGEVDFFA